MENKIMEAQSIEFVSDMGVFTGSFPLIEGNCFSVKVGEEVVDIYNIKYENLRELLKREVVKFPIKVKMVKENEAEICDGRIPKIWYHDRATLENLRFQILKSWRECDVVVDEAQLHSRPHPEFHKGYSECYKLFSRAFRHLLVGPNSK